MNLIAPHLIDWYTDIYITVYGQDTMYTDIMLRFNTYLKMLVNKSSFGIFTDIILIIGLLLTLFHFFGSLSEKAAAKQLSITIMGKSFCYLFLTIFFLFHTKEIFVFMLEFVESVHQMVEKAGNPTAVGEYISGFLKNKTVRLLMSRCVAHHFSFWAILGYTISGLLLTIVTLATKLFITYYAATRTVQLFVYYIFAPIGIANLFECDPSGIIDLHSSGMKYLKSMASIMFQIVLITAICSMYVNVNAVVNAGYFADRGDDTLEKLEESKNEEANKDENKEENKEETNKPNNEINPNDYLLRKEAINYPLKNFKYTKHRAKITELFYAGQNEVYQVLKELAKSFESETDKPDQEAEEEIKKEPLKDDEMFVLTDLINLSGKINKDYPGGKEKAKEKIAEIKEDASYRMTIESTELFFDWCIGSEGQKIVLFIILMATKVLLVMTSSKICDYIFGTST